MNRPPKILKDSRFTSRDGHKPKFEGYSGNDNPIWICSECGIKIWESMIGYHLWRGYIVEQYGSAYYDSPMTCDEYKMVEALG